MQRFLRWFLVSSLLIPSFAFAQPLPPGPLGPVPQNAEGSYRAASGTPPTIRPLAPPGAGPGLGNASGTPGFAPGPQLREAARERVEAWKSIMGERWASTTNAIKLRHDELKNAFGEQREAILQQIRERREELMMLFKNKHASTTDMLRERKNELTDEVKKQYAQRLENYFQKASEMLERHIDKLSGVADSMAERIANLEVEKGVDLSEASAFVEEAQSLLDEASVKAQEYSDAVVDAVGEEQGSAIVESMKALRQEIWALLQQAQQALRDAISSVKANLPPPASDTSNQ